MIEFWKGERLSWEVNAIMCEPASGGGSSRTGYDVLVYETALSLCSSPLSSCPVMFFEGLSVRIAHDLLQ